MREGRGRGGEGYISGAGCLSDVEHLVSLTFVSWLMASPPVATWSTLATAMRIMYWRGGGADTPGYRHIRVQTHQGTDTTSSPIDVMNTHLE